MTDQADLDLGRLTAEHRAREEAIARQARFVATWARIHEAHQTGRLLSIAEIAATIPRPAGWSGPMTLSRTAEIQLHHWIRTGRFPELEIATD